MSLLQQEPRQSLGESYTRGTSHVLIATVVAVVLVSIAMTVYVITGEKPPAATGEISEIWAHPMHSETSGFDASGAAIPKEQIDQVLLFTHVKLHNQSKQPIFLHQIIANATLPDGVHSSYAATPSDFERVFKAYPELMQWHATPISPDLTLQPGETKEGTFVCSYRMTKADWESRKGLNFTFNFQYLPGLTVEPKGTVTEREAEPGHPSESKDSLRRCSLRSPSSPRSHKGLDPCPRRTAGAHSRCGPSCHTACRRRRPEA